jgi:membrane protein DedA with SNARE-associated domain
VTVRGALRRRRAFLIALGAVAVGLFLAFWEGQLPDLTRNPTRAIGSLLPALGHSSAYPLLYLEESGVPLPLPGDVLVMYMGQQVRGEAFSQWLKVWAGLVVAQVLGATNLYLLSRRLGRDLPNSRVGRYLHVTEDRMRLAQRWFERWGPWVLVFGRHVPGLRIVLTIAAGISRVGLGVFIASVTVSSMAWVAMFLYLGARFGGTLEHLLDLHRGNYALLPLLVLLEVGGYVLYRREQMRRRPPVEHLERDRVGLR